MSDTMEAEEAATKALTPADRQLLAREVAADRYSPARAFASDRQAFLAGWDAALEWARKEEQQRAKAALVQDAMDGRIK